MQTISLKISDELLAELERAAKAKRVAKSVILRESLETALRPRARSRTASSFDLAADLAGSIKGLPRDLAHNPRYMDGFGEGRSESDYWIPDRWSALAADVEYHAWTVSQWKELRPPLLTCEP